MEREYLKQIAQIILEQLNYRRTEMWAWGSKNLYYLEREIDGEKYPSLKFSIRTPKVRRGGRVIISYNEGTDSYIVEAIRERNGEEASLGRYQDIYSDQLHDTINSLIEDKETFTTILF